MLRECMCSHCLRRSCLACCRCEQEFYKQLSKENKATKFTEPKKFLKKVLDDAAVEKRRAGTNAFLLPDSTV